MDPAKYVPLLLALMFTVVLAGCGGGGGSESSAPASTGTSPPAATPTGLWVNGGEGEGLEAYRSRLSRISEAGPADTRELAATADSSSANPVSDSSFSTTYTLDPAVDEYDIVKYDGKLLAVAPSRSACCFILDTLQPESSDAQFAPEEPPTSAVIRLFSTDPVSAGVSLEASIPLPEAQYAEGLYLSGTSLQVLSSSGWWGLYGARHLEPSLWEQQEVSLVGYDITLPDAPEVVTELRIEGALVSSRRVGDEILLISRHTPVLDGLIPYPQTEEEVANNQAILEEATDADILPAIYLNEVAVTPLSLDDCYRSDPEHPLAEELPADSIVTSILAFSVNTGEIVRSACALEPIDGVYVGSDYLALSLVRWGQDSQHTLLHLLSRDDFSYLGSEVLPGTLYSGGNADFRINEHEAVVRLVTTEWTDDPEDSLQHIIYTLEPDAEAPELVVLGTLGDAQDNRIGKPNEDLYGVRFMDDRAYLVTFERIDPLYIIDLSDPASPAILGELEVPGFSDLLHEVSDHLLLGLGLNAENFPKLELYDISDSSEPQTRGKVELGSEWDWSYSPALYNRYAFTYLAGSEIDRATVPYSASGRAEDRYQQIDRIALIEIRDKSDPARASVAVVGEIPLNPGSVSGDTRVIIDNDALFIIAYTDFLSGFWSNPEAFRPFFKP